MNTMGMPPIPTRSVSPERIEVNENLLLLLLSLIAPHYAVDKVLLLHLRYIYDEYNSTSSAHA